MSKLANKENKATIKFYEREHIQDRLVELKRSAGLKGVFSAASFAVGALAVKHLFHADAGVPSFMLAAQPIVAGGTLLLKSLLDLGEAHFLHNDLKTNFSKGAVAPHSSNTIKERQKTMERLDDRKGAMCLKSFFLAEASALTACYIGVTSYNHPDIIVPFLMVSGFIAVPTLILAAGVLGDYVENLADMYQLMTHSPKPAGKMDKAAPVGTSHSI